MWRSTTLRNGRQVYFHPVVDLTTGRIN